MENNPPAPAAPAPAPPLENPPPSAPPAPPAAPPAASAVLNGKTEAEIALEKKLKDRETELAETQDKLTQLKKLQTGNAAAPAEKKKRRLTFFDEEES